MLAPWKKSYEKTGQCIKKQRHHFTNKGPYNQSYNFPSSYVQMWEVDHKEGWAVKNWCFWTVVLEKTLESPIDIKEIKPFNPKGNQPWTLIGRTDAEAEAPILWPPEDWLIGKDPDAGKDCWTGFGSKISPPGNQCSVSGACGSDPSSRVKQRAADGPDNLCESTSADSKNPESAIWSSRPCLPVLGSLLCCIPQLV